MANRTSLDQAELDTIYVKSTVSDKDVSNFRWKATILNGIADYLSLTESSVISTDMLNQTQEFVKLHLNQLLEEFRTEGRTSSPTFRLWDDFLTKVMLPFKTFITSTKNAQWSVYQASKSKLLPLLFASNRTNYARYLPVILLMMQRLPFEVKDAFENGLFVAKLTDGRFNGVWMDYTLEATENKALKGNGGIIGLTLRGTALTRWFLARPVTAIYSTNFSGMLTNKHRVAQQQNPGKLISKSEVNRWNADVIKMKQMFDGTFSDPFSLNDPPLHLINFETGCVALPAVEESLIGALDKGLSMASTFIRDRLVPEQDGERPKKSFYAPLTRSNVKTMAVMNKTVKLSTQNISINGEVVYLRLLAVNATKQVPLQRLLSFENSPVPLSLFSEDGSPLSCVKSLFMHKLEGLLAEDKLTFVAGSDAIIFDGHAIIQMLPGPSGTEKVTFKDMAPHFIRYIFHVSEQHRTIKQIHVAFDRYDLESIKNIARQKRTAGRQGQEYHVQPDIQAPSNWNVFLSRGENKSNLAKCYTNYMKDHGGDLLKGDQVLYISGGQVDMAYRIDRHQCVQFPALASSQEADTRIVLHAIVAATTEAQQIIVSSPDTDVLVLLLHHRSAVHARKLFFLTGHTGKHAALARYIPVHHLYEKLSREQHNIMLSIYCITGCDTVSSFYGHGKTKAFNLIMDKSSLFQPLQSLGAQLEVTKMERFACTLFVGALYGKSGCDSLNKLRCEKASKKTAPKKLPPTEDSLSQHVLRTAYQLMIWRQADSVEQHIPDSIMYGYVKDSNNSLCPKMMGQSAAAPKLLNELVCNCKDNSCSTSCTCLTNKQPCTTACGCEVLLPNEDSDDICTNPLTISALCMEDSDSDHDD